MQFGSPVITRVFSPLFPVDENNRLLIEMVISEKGVTFHPEYINGDEAYAKRRRRTAINKTGDAVEVDKLGQWMAMVNWAASCCGVEPVTYPPDEMKAFYEPREQRRWERTEKHQLPIVG